MKLLLDTRTFIWFLRDPNILPPKIIEAIEEAGTHAAVSMASLWEIAIKVSLGKLTLPRPFDALFPEAVGHSGMTLLPIEFRHLTDLGAMPWHHRDPFDRLLRAC